MLTDEQVVQEQMYGYLYEGENRMGMLEHISRPIKGQRWCRMDNGDQMTLNEFKEIASPVSLANNGDSNIADSQDQDVNQFMNIQTDKEGNPILPTSGGVLPTSEANKSEFQDVVSPQQFKEQRTANDPVIKLLEKANTKEIILSVGIPIQVVDKKLVDVIIESFGEESKDSIYKFIIDKITQDQFKGIIEEMIEKYYNE